MGRIGLGESDPGITPPPQSGPLAITSAGFSVIASALIPAEVTPWQAWVIPHPIPPLAGVGVSLLCANKSRNLQVAFWRAMRKLLYPGTH